jgi:hypothetical protein
MAVSTNASVILRSSSSAGWRTRAWIDGTEPSKLRFALSWFGTELAGIGCYVVGLVREDLPTLRAARE